MGQYRKKPVIIQAVCWSGLDDTIRIINWISHVGGAIHGWKFDASGITIPTMEGEMTASPGDWIIQGVKGEFYPCKPEIFQLTYEEVK